MIVRLAEAEDIPAMVELGKSFYRKSAKAQFEFDELGAVALVAKCISSDRECAWVAERDGELVAMFIGAMQRWPYLKASYATNFLFVSLVPGAGRKLLQAFLRWAQQHGADQVHISISEGDSKAKDRLLERAGFARVGSRFTLDIKA